MIFTKNKSQEKDETTGSLERKPNTEALFAGIYETAKKQATDIIEEAKKNVELRKKNTGEQIERIVRSGKEDLKKRVDQISQLAKAQFLREKRRIELSFREEVYQIILNQVVESIKKQQLASHNTADKHSDKWKKVLFDWTVEAALGLGVEQAFLVTSIMDSHFIDEQFIEDCQNKITSVSKKTFTLELVTTTDNLPIDIELNEIEPGIILYSGDWRLVFDNTLSTRLRRLELEIRQIVLKSGIKYE
jgi:vacuolar-type H+-ATPase subunit E/Vma4